MDELQQSRMDIAILDGCSSCQRKRRYFERFYVEGIAERTAALLPVFGVARESLKRVVKRNRIMDGNRYAGYMYKEASI